MVEFFDVNTVSRSAGPDVEIDGDEPCLRVA